MEPQQSHDADDGEELAERVYSIVAQRLFSLGLSLQTVAARQPQLAHELQPLIDQTDTSNQRTALGHLPERLASPDPRGRERRDIPPAPAGGKPEHAHATPHVRDL